MLKGYKEMFLNNLFHICISLKDLKQNFSKNIILPDFLARLGIYNLIFKIL